MEEQIIEKLRQQDTKTQELFYKSYAAQMFRICYRYVTNESDAAEILNNGFYKVFTRMETFKNGGISGLVAWMKKIMVNECLQFIRGSKSIEFIDEYEVPDEYSLILPEIQLEAEDYYQFIKQLPDANRTVFNMFAIEGFTHKEIAETLQMPENTSRSHLLRARQMLIEKIKRYEDYGTK